MILPRDNEDAQVDLLSAFGMVGSRAPLVWAGWAVWSCQALSLAG